MDICTETKSHRLGCEIRLRIVQIIANWNTIEHDSETENYLNTNLDWIINHKVDFEDLKTTARRLKENINDNDISSIVRAVNQAEGEYYERSWSSHWYECPNGHPYFIGECGGAMETSRCLECNEQIGGGQHRLLQGNRRSGTLISNAMRG